MVAPFNQRFPEPEELPVVRQKFIERVNSGVLLELQQYNMLSYEESRSVRDLVITVLGIPYNMNMPLGRMINGEFRKCLRVVEICYDYFKNSGRLDITGFISHRIPAILRISDAECDLGLEWRDGRFEHKGIPELDQPVIEENLTWLSQKEWENVRAPLCKALSGVRSLSGDGKDVARDCYEAVEALAKNVTGRSERDLSGNAELLIAQLNGSEEMKVLLKACIKYANILHRHATGDVQGRRALSRAETEFFMHMCMAMIRFVKESNV